MKKAVTSRRGIAVSTKEALPCGSEEYVWIFSPHPVPTNEKFERLYIAIDGCIQGYFEISRIAADGMSVEFNANSWHAITNISQHYIPNFKYIHYYP